MNQTFYDAAPNTGVLALLPGLVTSVLDIGCGTGQLGAYLAGQAIVTDGITHNKAEEALAAKTCRRVWVFDLEHGLPSLDSRYDAIVLSHVLEHIADPSMLMGSLQSLLTSRGRVICAIPNMLFLHNRLRLLAGRVEYERYGLMDYTHVRWYTHKTLLDLFTRHGFVLDASAARGYLPLGPLRRILSQRTADRLDKWVVPMLPGLLACELLYRFRMA